MKEKMVEVGTELHEKFNVIKFDYVDQFGNHYAMQTDLDFENTDDTQFGEMVRAYARFLIVCTYGPGLIEKELNIEL
jgi:hypothetical protein